MPALDSFSATGLNLADVLLQEKLLPEDKVDELRVEEASTGKPVKAIIVEKKLLGAEDLAKAEAKVYGVEYVNLGERAVNPEALSLVPESVSQRYQLIPFDLNRADNLLSVAMANPVDLAAIEFVEKKSGVQVKQYIAPAEKIAETVATAYAQPLAAEVKAALKESGTGEVEQRVVDISELGKVIRQAPIAKIVSTILEFSMSARASDIHIEAENDKTRVRYRIDGILHEKLILPKQVHEAVISRIKILAGMKIDEKRIPQDGRFNFQANGQEVDLRVSSLPTSHGEKIVMRLLKKSGGVATLPDLGLRGTALKVLKESVLRPHGIIIVCGPTGSGKTTTLYSALSQINTPKVNIITVEDPVEYEISGVNQVQINPAAGLTFASGLRAIVRQDPNIIMVGEIRDKETTDLAIQAALTGHLVFSTLHTNDASGAIPRLLDLGAEPFLLASSMTCIVAQRVVRRICDECKEEYEPPLELVEDIKKVLGKLYQGQNGFKLYRGKGCTKCGGTGYLGRIGIYEVMPFTEKIGRLTLERPAAESIEKQAVAEGMITMKQDGYLKVLEGITTIEEVKRVAEE